jgi:hypothetical protein
MSLASHNRPALAKALCMPARVRPSIAIQRAAASYVRIPLSFQPNRGQIDPVAQ